VRVIITIMSTGGYTVTFPQEKKYEKYTLVVEYQKIDTIRRVTEFSSFEEAWAASASLNSEPCIHTDIIATQSEIVTSRDSRIIRKTYVIPEKN
jgi:hypothetical protein